MKKEVVKKSKKEMQQISVRIDHTAFSFCLVSIHYKVNVIPKFYYEYNSWIFRKFR